MDELKKIVATFVKKNPSEIDSNTIIGKRVVSGSILVHRMYAAINSAGYTISDYNDINTYGELINRLNGTTTDRTLATSAITQNFNKPSLTDERAVGIDIESISNFPAATDFREDNFYKDNFSAREISYSILKPKPTETFAGLFSAKEALCKADERIKKIPFNQIEIMHDDNGKPIFPGFSVSISHDEQKAIAVAVANESSKPTPAFKPELKNLEDKYDARLSSLKKMVMVAFIIATIAVITAIVALTKIP